MSLIIPVSDSARFGTGGIWAPTSANFPCAKNFLQMKEPSGNSLYDVIKEVSVTGLTGTISSADSGKGISLSTNSTNIATPAGYWGAIGTFASMFMTVQQIVGAVSSAHVLRAGLTTGARIGLHTATNGLTFNDGTASFLATPTGIASGAKVALAATNFFSGGNANPVIKAYDFSDFSYTSVAATPAASTGITISDGLTINGVTVLSAVYGQALFVFAGGLPTDIDVAIKWMAHHWALGNKWIYPAWKGLA